MDSVFSLNEGDLATFIQHMVQSYGCRYICLWPYDPSTNCLGYKGGFYSKRSNHPSSSSGSLAQRLFIEYGQSMIIVDSSHIPGRAFANNIPYMELRFADLLRIASTEIQLQFYHEAGIKNAIFMGCKTGEIELGFSYGLSPVNLEMEMRTLFPDDFNQQFAPTSRDFSQLSTAADQNRPASSSSSLRSLPYDSPEYSPLLFDIPTTSYLVPENPQPQEAVMVQQLPLGSSHPVPTVASTPHEQAIRALSQIRNIQLPTIESVDDAMTRAIIAVLSSSSSPASASSPQQQNLPTNAGPVTGSQTSAFRRYGSSSGLGPRIPVLPSGVRTQIMLKRSLAFLRTLNSMRPQPTRASAIQLHHMISERRRREKLNESFQTLRSLLPPGTKKDKASVLACTTEHLSSLKSEVAELHKRNQLLEAQILPKKAAVEGTSASGSPSNEGVEVQMTNVVAASISAARFVDVRVTTRSGNVSMVDLVVSLLEFLKADRNVNLMSVYANTTLAGETTLVHNVVLRLRIEEDDEWDESAFQEAIKIVNGLPQ